jgi:hypothetical protein
MIYSVPAQKPAGRKFLTVRRKFYKGLTVKKGNKFPANFKSNLTA